MYYLNYFLGYLHILGLIPITKIQNTRIQYVCILYTLKKLY